MGKPDNPVQQPELPAVAASPAPAAAPAQLSVAETIRHLALRAAIDTARTTGVSVSDDFYMRRAAG